MKGGNYGGGGGGSGARNSGPYGGKSPRRLTILPNTEVNASPQVPVYL